MKIGGKKLAFRDPLPWPTRRRLRFLRKGNTLHLQETALVVEGPLQRLAMPLIDLLAKGALSEWSMLTVPYSRVLDYRFGRRLIRRWLAVLVILGPALLLTLNGLFDPRHDPVNRVNVVTAAACWWLVGGVIAYYLAAEPLGPRNRLLFRQADGKKAILLFTIRDKKLQGRFEQRMRANLDAARQRRDA